MSTSVSIYSAGGRKLFLRVADLTAADNSLDELKPFIPIPAVTATMYPWLSEPGTPHSVFDILCRRCIQTVSPVVACWVKLMPSK
jgi:hypothetical protein